VEAQARDLVAQADKKISKGRGTSKFVTSIFGSAGKEQKFEEAIDLLQQAANKYKAVQKWDEAGDAFAKCAECAILLRQHADAADHLNSAFICYKKGSPQKALEALERAIPMFLENGRVSKAAVAASAAGELCETELGNAEKAIEYHLRSAEFNDRENARTTAMQARQKAARQLAKMERYAEAIELFEKIGLSYVEDPLLKTSARGNFFNAMLCSVGSLTADTLRDRVPLLEEQFARYTSTDAMFAPLTREHQLITGLLKAANEVDVEEYSEAVTNYDATGQLDDLQNRLVLRGKQALKAARADIR